MPPTSQEQVQRRAAIRELLTQGPAATQAWLVRALEDLGFFCVDNLLVPLLGRFVDLVAKAREAGFADLAVISAVGTRYYYRRLGFVDGALYQHRRVAPP